MQIVQGGKVLLVYGLISNCETFQWNNPAAWATQDYYATTNAFQINSTTANFSILKNFHYIVFPWSHTSADITGWQPLPGSCHPAGGSYCIMGYFWVVKFSQIGIIQGENYHKTSIALSTYFSVVLYS